MLRCQVALEVIQINYFILFIRTTFLFTESRIFVAAGAMAKHRYVGYNDMTTLPDDIFDGLSSLLKL